MLVDGAIVVGEYADKQIARGVGPMHAYVQAATCGVSRSSLLTSRRPDTTQVLNNGECPFTTRPEHANWVSTSQCPIFLSIFAQKLFILLLVFHL